MRGHGRRIRPPVAPLHAPPAQPRPDRDRARRGLLHLGHRGEPLPRRARRPLLREHRLRAVARDRRGRARPARAAPVLHELGRLRDAARRSSSRTSWPSSSRSTSGAIFFVSGGSEAVESALKVARQYHRLRGEPTRYKYVTRRSAYHGTTMGAISINGSPALRSQFEPLLPGCLRAPMPYRYRCPYCAEKSACTLQCADEIDDIIRNEDPLTVAAVILEPVQNSAGSIVAAGGLLRPRPRDLRRARRPARGRRGDLRLRPRRRLVRLDPLRDQAGHDDPGQGPHLARTRRSARSSRARR